MSANTIEITDSNFDQIKSENDSLIIDCWAEWCGPCKMIAPIIDELAADYSGKITFGKLDADENRGLVMDHGIMAIPTLLFFKGGEEVHRIIGLVPKEDIEAKIRELL